MNSPMIRISLFARSSSPIAAPASLPTADSPSNAASMIDSCRSRESRNWSLALLSIWSAIPGASSALAATGFYESLNLLGPEFAAEQVVDPRHDLAQADSWGLCSHCRTRPRRIPAASPPAPQAQGCPASVDLLHPLEHEVGQVHVHRDAVDLDHPHELAQVHTLSFSRSVSP
jgi:hypothetical protein